MCAAQVTMEDRSIPIQKKHTQRNQTKMNEQKKKITINTQWFYIAHGCNANMFMHCIKVSRDVCCLLVGSFAC